MVLNLPSRPPLVPMVFRRLSNGEYSPPAHPGPLRMSAARVRAEGPNSAAHLSMSLAEYWSGRQGTAAALLAIDKEWGGGFYDIPKEAALDRAAADEALGGGQLVVDVQTHYHSNLRHFHTPPDYMVSSMEAVAPERFKGLSKIVGNQRQVGFSFLEFLRCVYLDSETAVAILSAGPGVEGKDPKRPLTNGEMRGTRELIERLGGTGRLINHATIHPNVPGEIDLMDRWADWCKPAGWKVYTMYGAEGSERMKQEHVAWMLDDEASGRPFLQRCLETGVRFVSAHKGLSSGADTGWDGPSSPKDIGPAAKAFPGINFLVYHSGYESKVGEEREEGPYSEEDSHFGTNRLIRSLKDAGIGPGGNVYAELGATWYLLMGNPIEACHVMGKLLSALGEDNILWGTDSCFYGAAQPMIDALRAFQIPEEFSQRYGYPPLTDRAKEKILGLNACRIYDIDPEETRARVRKDDLAWVKAAMEEYKVKGAPTHV